jgi:DNA-binding NarL/FixJ family response regulator
MSKRVFILSRHSLFSQGIETLLAQESEFEIVGRDKGFDAAAEFLETCHPDVMILDCDDPEPDLSPAVLCVLRKRLGIRVIGLSLLDNRIYVYRGEEKQVCQLEDLLEAIEG